MRSPGERGLAYEDVWLVGADVVKAHAWFLPAPADQRASAVTLLFSHENAGSMALRLPMLQMLHTQFRCNILAYDYRGYGDSDDATIGEEGLMRDAHAAWEWLLTKGGVDPTKMTVNLATMPKVGPAPLPTVHAAIAHCAPSSGPSVPPLEPRLFALAD